MTVMLHSNTQDLEGVHADACVLDSLFALKDQVDGPGDKANEGVAFRGRQENPGQLQAQDLAHGVEGGLELGRAVPVTVLIAGAGLLAPGLPAPDGGGGGGLLSRLGLDTGYGPLQQEAVDLEKLFVV